MTYQHDRRSKFAYIVRLYLLINIVFKELIYLFIYSDFPFHWYISIHWDTHLKITLWGINHVYIDNVFLYSIPLKKDNISSISTFLNMSILLKHRKNCKLRAKSLYSRGTFLVLSRFWHSICFSWLSINKRVSLVWALYKRDMISSYFLHFLRAGLQSPKMVFNMKSLVCMLLFQLGFHFFNRKGENRKEK